MFYIYLMKKFLLTFLFLILSSCASNQTNNDENYRNSLKSSYVKESCNTYLRIANSFGLEVAEDVADIDIKNFGFGEGDHKSMNRMCIDIYLTEFLTPYKSKKLKPEGYTIDYNPRTNNSLDRSFLKELGEWTELLFGIVVLIAESETYSSSDHNPSYDLRDYGYDHREKISFDKNYDTIKSSKGSINIYDPPYGSGFQVIENGNDFYYRDAFGSLNDLDYDYIESSVFEGRKVLTDPYDPSRKIVIEEDQYKNYSIKFVD